MTELAEAPSVAPLSVAIASDPYDFVRCPRCEYALRGLAREGRCPECGLAVEASRNRAEAEQARGVAPLRLSARKCLRAMGLGCCVLIGLALFTAVDAWLTVKDLVEYGPAMSAVATVVGLLPLVAIFLGLWLLGARQPLATGRSHAGGYYLRVTAVLMTAAPFALVGMSTWLGNGFVFYLRVSIVFAVVGGLATLIIMRRLANAARRADHLGLARGATAFGWAAPGIWIAQSIFDPYIPYGDSAEWLLNVHPVIGFSESIVIVPYRLIAGAPMDLSLWAWLVQALVSLAGVMLLAVMARVFFQAAAKSPRVVEG